MEDNLKRLFELSEIAKRNATRYEKRRSLHEELAQSKGRTFIGIVGPRGIGKTVLLRQLALEFADSFYLSLDTIADADLFTLAKKLTERYGIKLLFLDEIHFLRGYEAALKNIFDFLDLKVIFTSSVALSLYESAHDLSRRVTLKHLYPFSFREFLSFKGYATLTPLTVGDIVDRHWTAQYERWSHLFDEYLQGGLFPFALEEPDTLSVLGSITEKVITRDIATAANLRADEIEMIRKLVKFVGRAASEDVNYSTISRNVGITKYKAEQYVRFLEKSFILNPIFPAGTNVLKEPKVLMWVPLRLLYKSYEEAVGELREDFVAQALKMHCGAIYYLKSSRGEKTPDFLLEDKGRSIVVEVGGKGKGKHQFKGFRAREKIIFSHGGNADGLRRPLELLGYL